MKKVTLFACLFVLTLGASAQNASSISPVAIPPNARGGEKKSASPITVADHAVTGQPANAVTSSSARALPPIAVTPPNSVHVPPVAKK
jgi:hypothetical protein